MKMGRWILGWGIAAGLAAAPPIVLVHGGAGSSRTRQLDGTEAAARKDLPVVQLVSLLLVAIFVVLNAVADLLSALIDPDTITAGRQA